MCFTGSCKYERSDGECGAPRPSGVYPEDAMCNHHETEGGDEE